MVKDGSRASGVREGREDRGKREKTQGQGVRLELRNRIKLSQERLLAQV